MGNLLQNPEINHRNHEINYKQIQNFVLSTTTKTVPKKDLKCIVQTETLQAYNSGVHHTTPNTILKYQILQNSKNLEKESGIKSIMPLITSGNERLERYMDKAKATNKKALLKFGVSRVFSGHKHLCQKLSKQLATVIDWLSFYGQKLNTSSIAYV